MNRVINLINGIGASPGISLGKVLLKDEPKLNVVKRHIQNIDAEIERFNHSIEISISEVEQLYQLTKGNIGEKEADIFYVHKMMLQDKEFFGNVIGEIRKKQINPEYALKEVIDNYINALKNVDDEYLRERVLDLEDVSKRLLKVLLGLNNKNSSILDDKYIVVAEDLTPSDAAQMDKEKILGFITETGGKTSHTAIMARTLEIPAVVGVKNATKIVSNGDFVIIDGYSGIIIINPSEKEIESYKMKKENYKHLKDSLVGLIGEKTITKDGISIEIAGNIGSSRDVLKVIENDGEEIGLFRTEFLYMSRDELPTEAEQFEAYKNVAVKMNGKPVIIRTLDIGGDKGLKYLKLPQEVNPFLGYRAIRLSLDNKDIFKVQLRAILRASAYGNIKIMFPMISNLNELRQAKSVVEEVKTELKSEKVDFDENIQIGIMVEIPSVCIQSDLFAKEVDFFCIGTNDLVQYTLAVDRGNENVSHLYSPYNPAILRLIKMTIDNGHNEGIQVGMCGEAAGDPKLIPILIGMGLDEFSMSSSFILKARWIMRNTSKKEMENVVQKVLNMSTAEEVEKYLDENMKFI